MPLLFLMFMLCILSGCTGYQDPDFDKPLIILPEDRDNNSEISDTKSENREIKPPQQQAWADAKTSRIWVSPHVDENGDYVEGYYKYIVLVPGHWILNGSQTTK